MQLSQRLPVATCPKYEHKLMHFKYYNFKFRTSTFDNPNQIIKFVQVAITIKQHLSANILRLTLKEAAERQRKTLLNLKFESTVTKKIC